MAVESVQNQTQEDWIKFHSSNPIKYYGERIIEIISESKIAHIAISILGIVNIIAHKDVSIYMPSIVNDITSCIHMDALFFTNISAAIALSITHIYRICVM